MNTIDVLEKLQNFVTEKAQHYHETNPYDLTDEEQIKSLGALEMLQELQVVLLELGLKVLKDELLEKIKEDREELA